MLVALKLRLIVFCLLTLNQAADDQCHRLIKRRVPAETGAFSVSQKVDFSEFVERSQVWWVLPLVNHYCPVCYSYCQHQTFMLGCKLEILGWVFLDEVCLLMPLLCLTLLLADFCFAPDYHLFVVTTRSEDTVFSELWVSPSYFPDCTSMSFWTCESLFAFPLGLLV